jgi:2-hydroxychromene-2-carboxylate isomerase
MQLRGLLSFCTMHSAASRGKGVRTSAIRPVTYAIDVYLDIKSPHSYLMVKPALQLEDDYNCTVTFKPYDLSYVAMGISTVHDPKDPKRRPANAQAERRAKMYYSVAREYARMMGIEIRGPHSLLTSTAANMGILFTAQEGKAHAYTEAVYRAGWPSGWRDYDVQSIDQLQNTMRSVGLSEKSVLAFAKYVAHGEGERELAECMKEAEESGIVGVPHVVFELRGRRTGWFGREHLSFVRHVMHDRGLARRADVRAPISHYWSGGSATVPS